MGLVKNLPPVEREVPHERGNFFSFRRLSAEEMDEAQAASIKETIDRFGAQAMEIFGKMATPKAAEKATEDPLAGFSERALVQNGVVGWRGEGYPPDEFSHDRTAELDTATRHWAALQVMELSRISEGEV